MKVAAENYPHAINHFALGNMYSVVEDYRRAIIHYSAALKREPTFEEALLRKGLIFGYFILWIEISIIYHRKLDTIRPEPIVISKF